MALGSVAALSDSSGDSCQSYEYSVFGQVAASDPNFIANPYMFTGRRFDYETGLYCYSSKSYNPYGPVRAKRENRSELKE